MRSWQPILNRSFASAWSVCSGTSTAARVAGLTRRRRDALSLLAKDPSNMEIAGAPRQSDKSARIHVSVNLKSLKVRYSTQAALIAARLEERLATDERVPA